jgi:membrane protease subunit (stomatin/prohibitin family)
MSSPDRQFNAAEVAKRRTQEHQDRADAAAKARHASLASASALISCTACGRITAARKRCRNCGASVIDLPPLAIAAKQRFGRRRHRRGSAI